VHVKDQPLKTTSLTILEMSTKQKRC